MFMASRQETEQRAEEIGNRSFSGNDMDITYRMWLMGQCLAGADLMSYRFDESTMSIAKTFDNQVQAILYQLAMRELKEKPNEKR